MKKIFFICLICVCAANISFASGFGAKQYVADDAIKELSQSKDPLEKSIAANIKILSDPTVKHKDRLLTSNLLFEQILQLGSNKELSDELKTIKLSLAVSLSYSEVFYKIHKLDSEQAKHTIEKAEHYWASFKNMVLYHFEYLTLKDIELITKDNPESIYRITQYIPYAAHSLQACTEADYNNLKKKFSLSVLSEQMPLIITYLDRKEMLHKTSYYKNLYEVFKQKKEGEKIIKNITKFAPLFFEEPINQVKVKKQIEHYEKRLSKKGLDKVKAYQMGKNIAAIAPGCMQLVSYFNITDKIRIDLAKEKGLVLLKKYQKILSNNKENIGDLNEHFKSQKFGFYEEYGDLEIDPWGNSYFIKLNPKTNNYDLYSYGPDEDSEDDDILVGEL